MTSLPASGSSLAALLPLASPAAAAIAALCCRPGTRPEAAWAAVRPASVVALAAALLAVASAFAQGPALLASVRLDRPGAIVLLLIAFIGWVLARYSATYLQGEPGEPRYARWLAATLAGSMAVVLANHLVLLALAWWWTSVCLHKLLVFYSERPAARIAAHKKFVMARVADTCMVLACALIGWDAGTLQLDALAAHATAAGSLSPLAQAGVVLVALAAALKCAQLPFHGWLIQVMEAPTPVSALLHAGVVNLGGFVLLRLAPLVEATLAAQVLLVLVGTATAVLAALVMTTRISVKVALAWSTCAQMGFMLMQCGLGVWEMALLHLVAHSLYKAHAFLSSGEVVRHTLVGRLVPLQAPSRFALAAAAAGGLALCAAAAATWNVQAGAQPALWVLGAIVALALQPLLAGHGDSALPLRAWATAFVLAWIYFGLHTVLSAWVVPPSGFASALWAVPAAGFAALFLLQPMLADPRSAASRLLHPWFYGGLFLDERVSRALFRLVPLARS